MEKSNALVISHAKCNDGLLAAYYAKKSLLLEDENIFFLSHTDNIEEVLEKGGFFNKLNDMMVEDSPILYVLDYSLKQPLLERLLKDCPKLHIITLDHHKGAKEAYDKMMVDSLTINEAEVSGRFTFCFNNNRSGAALAYYYFVEDMPFDKLRALEFADVVTHEKVDQLPRHVAYIEDRDLWKWSSDKVNDDEFNASIVEDMVEEGELLLDYHNDQLEQLLPDANDISVIINGEVVKGKLINSNMFFTSDIANKLCTLNKEVKFAISYSIGKDMIAKCGVRSLPDFNCRPIAEYFGGGGHDQASGFGLKGLEAIHEGLNKLLKGEVEITV